MLNQNMVIVIWLNYVVSYAEEQGHLCVFVTSKREVTEAPCRRVTFITSCEIIDTSSAPKTWEKRMPAFTLSPLQVRQIKSGMWIDSETSNSKRRHCNYLNRCVRAKSIHFKGQIQSVKSSSKVKESRWPRSAHTFNLCSQNSANLVFFPNSSDSSYADAAHGTKQDIKF